MLNNYKGDLFFAATTPVRRFSPGRERAVLWRAMLRGDEPGDNTPNRSDVVLNTLQYHGAEGRISGHAPVHDMAHGVITHCDRVSIDDNSDLFCIDLALEAKVIFERPPWVQAVAILGTPCRVAASSSR